MNQKEIQDLIKYVSRSRITEVEIEKKDFKITIKSEPKSTATEEENRTVYIPQSMPQYTQPIPAPMPQAVPTQPVAAPAQVEQPVAVAEDTNYITINSPMIGTFYRASSPDKPVFIEVGDDVKKGDTVCIIEAMKLFNEIESEIQGRIVKVLVDDASPVEYDQPLFVVDPS